MVHFAAVKTLNDAGQVKRGTQYKQGAESMVNNSHEYSNINLHEAITTCHRSCTPSLAPYVALPNQSTVASHPTLFASTPSRACPSPSNMSNSTFFPSPLSA